MPNRSPDRTRNILLATAIFIAAFLSFNYNAFGVVSRALFETHQIDSERLVLDGLLNREFQDSRQAKGLGHYVRTGADSALSPRKAYAIGARSETYIPYESQFGFQVRFFGFFAKWFAKDVSFLQAITSLLMCAVLLLYYLGASREFGRRGAFLFCLVFILSPWIVIFARNLYWIEATWFLPAALSLLWGGKALQSSRVAALMYLSLFAAFLAKFLCGYEYITTIALSAYAPIAYFSLKKRIGYHRVASGIVLTGVSMLSAFAVSMTLHAASLSPEIGDGFSKVRLTAEKRLSSSKPEAIARDACIGEADVATCEDDISKSLSSNRMLVLARYLAVPDFLPWIGRGIDVKSGKASLKAALAAARDKGIQALPAGLNGDAYAFIIAAILSAAAFLAFCMLVARKAWLRKDALSAFVMVAFLAPVSWYVLAKGHSFNHYHLNYVLWYLLFVPAGVLLLSHRDNLPNEKKESTT